jgi:hypothetical protein
VIGGEVIIVRPVAEVQPGDVKAGADQLRDALLT